MNKLFTLDGHKYKFNTDNKSAECLECEKLMNGPQVFRKIKSTVYGFHCHKCNALIEVEIADNYKESNA